jgi:GNAT superfamily N-acetyltransferase
VGARVGDIPVREAAAEDLPTLRALAGRTEYVSRFAFDPRFAPRAAEYFAAWIERADAVLVAHRDGRTLGYITCRLPESGVDSWFGIVAVDDEARERGVGTALLGAGSDWLLERGMKTVSVAVAARNIATLRYVERFGFMASKFELWFHKWYDEGS